MKLNERKFNQSQKRVKKTLKNTKFEFDCAECRHAQYNEKTKRFQCLKSLTGEQTVVYKDYAKDILTCIKKEVL